MPINANDALQLILDDARKYPVGSRFTDGDETYTVIAIEALPSAAGPLLLADEDVAAGRTDYLTDGEVGEDLTPAPDNREIVQAALALASKDRESLTQYGNREVMMDNPTDIEQLKAFLKFAEADREWRIAERAQLKAAQNRSMQIAQTVWASGNNQSQAGRLLGLDQSRISRAVETARQLTGGDSS